MRASSLAVTREMIKMQLKMEAVVSDSRDSNG